MNILETKKRVKCYKLRGGAKGRLRNDNHQEMISLINKLINNLPTIISQSGKKKKDLSIQFILDEPFSRYYMK